MKLTIRSIDLKRAEATIIMANMANMANIADNLGRWRWFEGRSLSA